MCDASVTSAGRAFPQPGVLQMTLAGADDAMLVVGASGICWCGKDGICWCFEAGVMERVVGD